MRRLLLILLPAVVLAGCQTPPPMATVDSVDLKRFMGDWYVIAHIPTFIETNAYNAVESYALGADGSIATTFSFREGGFDGESRRYTPTGFVLDQRSNAVWGMQFVWPIRADYRIVFLSPDYSQTVVARAKRDYVWVMARTPFIPATDYERMVALIGTLGYDTTQLRKVPQQWN